jgi:A/G-specific adenine glycosylase
MAARPLQDPLPASAAELTPARIEALRLALCAWFAASARDLPWRRLRDPYAIWISETMLQQTQVATVVPYWERFLARFPDPTSLAEASDSDLLAHWSGLGYYSRARNLRAAARVIAEQYHGRLPRRLDELLALPGIGRYTAGAILSIAFAEPAPLVDGNVARVFARLFGLDAPLGSPAMQRSLWTLAELLVPPAGTGPDGPGAWNQALMELGALLCVSGQPRCLLCPLQPFCVARGAGREAELPVRRQRPAAVAVELELLLITDRGRLLMHRRPALGRLAGLLDLPTRETSAPARLYPPVWPARGLSAAGPLGELRHAITRHQIRGRVLLGACDFPGGALDPTAGLLWIPIAELRSAPLSGLAKKAWKRFSASLPEPAPALRRRAPKGYSSDP